MTNADLRWAKGERDIDNLTKIQAKMIDRAARLVKPGGLLVYSTCTIIRAENDQIVEEFLARNDAFEIDSAAAITALGRRWPSTRAKTYRASAAMPNCSAEKTP